MILFIIKLDISYLFLQKLNKIMYNGAIQLIYKVHVQCTVYVWDACAVHALLAGTGGEVIHCTVDIYLMHTIQFISGIHVL